MIYHYYDPWSGVQVWNQPRTTTNTPVWSSSSGLGTITKPQISVVKSDKHTTLVVRDNDGHIAVIIDLSAEEAADLVERLTNDNTS